MFATKRDITKELKKLIEATESLPRGTLVTYEDMEKITGLFRDERPFKLIIRKWKRKIKDLRGVEVLPSVPPGVGYRFLGVDEQLVVQPAKLKKHAVNKINKAAACIGSIPDEELDEAGKSFRVVVLDQLAELKEKDKSQRAAVNSLLSAPKVLPKITGN